MRKTIFCFLFAFAFANANSQTDTLICDYPDRDTVEFESLPWFGNNAYLDNFLDSIGYPGPGARIIGSNQARFHVPIKFWVYRSSSGTGGPDLRDLRNYIDNLNRFYNVDNNTLIGFYMKCQIDYIDDDDNLDVGYLEAQSLIQSHKEPGCINVHIVNTLNNDALGISYRARFFGVDAIFVTRATYTRPDLASTLPHEVGHYFELDHTHQYSNRGKCRKEAIDRNRTWPNFLFCPFGGGGSPASNIICESTGDGLSDTPADPDLSSNFSCNFGLTGLTDPWDDHYETPPVGSSVPDTRNLMSYNGDRACRVIFSRRQIGVMLYSIYDGKSRSNKSRWENLRAEYDEYEPDNNDLMARPIQLAEIQERNFHQQYNGDDIFGNPIWSSCDIDWIRFVAPCNNSFEIFTSEMAGYAHANTRLTLFDNALNQLAQNDDISPTNQFSSINWDFVAGQEYFIRVENMSPTLTGYYRLQIEGAFTGPSILCSSETYSFQNAPPGATFNWSVSPLGIASPNPATGSSTTLIKTGNGNIILTAQVTNFCGADFTATKAIAVGSPQPGPITVVLVDYHIGRIQVQIDEVPGATSYNWYKDGVLQTIYHGTFAQIPITRNRCNVGYAIEVLAINACGTSARTYKGVYVPCDGGFKLSPNPTSNTVTVSVNENNESTNSGFDEVKIYDQQSNLKIYRRFNKVTSATIDVGSLFNGIYVVEISSGDYKERQQLIVQK